MTVRPGKNLVWVAASLLVVALATALWSAAAWLMPLLAVVAAGLAVRDFTRLRHSFRGVRVLRELPAIVGRDMPFEVTLRFLAEAPHALSGTMRDGVSPRAEPSVWISPLYLPAGGSAELRQTFRMATRGRYQFGPVWLRLAGPAGLLEGQQALDCHGAVQVLPEGLVSREQLSRDAAQELRLLEKQMHTRQRGTGTEFESLSEFRTGDDPRRIDWRTTARCRHLIVRRYQVERCRDMMILLDCGRLMGSDAGKGTKLDCAVDAALLLARVALSGGDRCGLGVFDDRVQGYLPPIGGPQAMHTLTTTVCDLQSQWLETDFSPMFSTLQSRQTKRALVVILSDIADVETSERYRVSLATLAKRHIVLFAALQTPLLKAVVHAPVTEVLDGFRKAVSLRILREREAALHGLRRSGVHVLDVTPSQLTLPLVNQYLSLRRQNVL